MTIALDSTVDCPLSEQDRDGESRSRGPASSGRIFEVPIRHDLTTKASHHARFPDPRRLRANVCRARSALSASSSTLRACS